MRAFRLRGPPGALAPGAGAQRGAVPPDLSLLIVDQQARRRIPHPPIPPPPGPAQNELSSALRGASAARALTAGRPPALPPLQGVARTAVLAIQARPPPPARAPLALHRPREPLLRRGAPAPAGSGRSVTPRLPPPLVLSGHAASLTPY